MPTRIFRHTGAKVFEFHRSVVIFFLFIGNLFHSAIFKWPLIVWKPTIVTTLRSGAVIVLPLIVVSMLIGASLAFGIHYILAPFNLQNQAMFVAQNTLIRDIAPLPIGFILCVQSGLNLINRNHPSFRHPAEQIMLENIIPLLVGMNLTAMLLYAYIFVSFFVSIFSTFYFLLNINTDEYLLRLSGIINPIDVITSFLKTIIYATIASFTAGYYYYDVAHRTLAVRKAVSRIITRSLFWLVVVTVFLKIYFP